DSPRGGRRARRYCSHSRSRPRDDCPSAIALWASSGQPFTVGRVEMIEDLGGLQSGLIVAERPRLDSPEHGFEALGVGHGNATDIKEVNRVADRGERRMRVEPEAAEKHLERDPASDVGELGAVEIEAERTPGTAARDIDPGEPRLLVDEAPDEPDACQAVDPEVLARHPHAPAVFSRVEAAKASLRGARLPVEKSFPTSPSRADIASLAWRCAWPGKKSIAVSSASERRRRCTSVSALRFPSRRRAPLAAPAFARRAAYSSPRSNSLRTCRTCSGALKSSCTVIA